MHSGVFRTLDDVLRFYVRISDGNSQNPKVNSRQIDPKIRNLRIQNNAAAIIAFINTIRMIILTKPFHFLYRVN